MQHVRQIGDREISQAVIFWAVSFTKHLCNTNQTSVVHKLSKTKLFPGQFNNKFIKLLEEIIYPSN